MFTLMVAGCRSVAVAPVEVDAMTDYNLVTFPAVGSTVTKGIGEPLIHQGDAKTGDTIELEENIVIGDISIPRGQYSEVKGTQEFRKFYVGNMVRGGRAAKYQSVILLNDDEGTKRVCITRKACVEAKFSLGRKTKYSPSKSQQTLIYSGKIGNRITLGYREFFDNSAKPAFSNDVAYDLSESKVLGYKGARLEVIGASNTEITYKVVAGFN